MLLLWIVSVIVYWFVSITAILILGESMVAMYYIGILLLLNLFQILIATWTYQALKRGEVIQPIGKGIIYIWEYFTNDTQNAAKFFITSQIV
jgi:hypothetical protein